MVRYLIISLLLIFSFDYTANGRVVESANTVSADTAHFFKSISASKAAKIIKLNENKQRFVILDVRASDDYNKGHIFNAININFKSSDFPIKLDELDRGMTYLVYCYGGIRSKQTMQMMKDKNFTSVYNMKGGMMKWKAKGLPVVETRK